MSSRASTSSARTRSSCSCSPSTMVPFTMLLIPLYLTFIDVRFSNNYLAIALPTMMSAYGDLPVPAVHPGHPARPLRCRGHRRRERRRDLPGHRAAAVASCPRRPRDLHAHRELQLPDLAARHRERRGALHVAPRVGLVRRQGEATVFTETLAAAIIGSIPTRGRIPHPAAELREGDLADRPGRPLTRSTAT